MIGKYFARLLGLINVTFLSLEIFSCDLSV